MPTDKFKKGRKKTGGRKKGSLNKFTTLKEAYLDAFNSEEIGGSKGIVEAFKPTAFTKRDFFRLMAKMLPANVDFELSGSTDKKRQVIIKVVHVFEKDKKG